LTVKHLRFYAALFVLLGVVTFGAQQQTPQQPPPQQPPPTADPYANNANAGTLQFPLAAPAGRDSNARNVAPAGAGEPGRVQRGQLEVRTRVRSAAGSQIWNPVRLKMKAGGKVTGGTVFSATDPATYCAMANAGYDFIWTEMQHNDRDWGAAARMWRTCPNASAVPGVRVAYTDEREIQHALDAGALVVVVPTVDTVEEAIEARNWTYFPPLGRRSNGGGQAFDGNMWGGVPGGYRQTINDNVVLILMIETLEGLKNADEIAKVPGVTAVFAASGDLGNFSGFRQGSPDYERAINIVHDAAIKAQKRLCGPFAWRDRPDFTCFQAGSETAAIARGVKDELGALANTQPKPAVGPFAVKPKS
jgi:2-keto-3-deoxy-L-rhamnonate aldolase RhmA